VSGPLQSVGTPHGTPRPAAQWHRIHELGPPASSLGSATERNNSQWMPRGVGALTDAPSDRQLVAIGFLERSAKYQQWVAARGGTGPREYEEMR
jgi:hypothetical protein